MGRRKALPYKKHGRSVVFSKKLYIIPGRPSNLVNTSER